MISRHVLAFFCGVCFATLGLANSSNFVSQSMKKDMDKLSKHFKANSKELYGNPVFLKKILEDFDSDFNETEQKLLMHEVLDVYLSLLSNLRNCTDEEDVRSSIDDVRVKVQVLQKQYFQQQGHALRRHLQYLWAIQTNDLTVQRKALRELMQVFEKAAKLGSRIWEKKERRRRRRQVRRSRVQG